MSQQEKADDRALTAAKWGFAGTQVTLFLTGQEYYLWGLSALSLVGGVVAAGSILSVLSAKRDTDVQTRMRRLIERVDTRPRWKTLCKTAREASVFAVYVAMGWYLVAAVVVFSHLGVEAAARWVASRPTWMDSKRVS